MLRLLLGARRERRRPAHVLAVANAMLDVLDADDQRADLIRLQRMLVLAQCASLSTRGEPLFADAIVVLGDTPGIVAVHSAFRSWWTRPIDGRAKHPDLDFDHPADDDAARLDVLREVARGCRGVRGMRLGDLLRRIAPDARNGETLPIDLLSMPLATLIAPRPAIAA